MLQPLESLLFFDIETVPEIWTVEDREKYPKKDIRTERYYTKEEERDGRTSFRVYQEKAALYPEFGKIVCISYAYGVIGDGDLKVVTKSSPQPPGQMDEAVMLMDFFQILKQTGRALGGHNIKGFDIPYVIKRALNHGLKIPKKLHIFGKKPREVKMVDTMESFKMGSWRNTSLELCTQFLGLPNPKQDITGKEVPEYYYGGIDSEDDQFEQSTMLKISKYCEADAEASLRVYYELFRSVNNEKDEK